jgi:hypothetical protein
MNLFIILKYDPTISLHNLKSLILLIKSLLLLSELKKMEKIANKALVELAELLIMEVIASLNIGIRKAGADWQKVIQKIDERLVMFSTKEPKIPTTTKILTVHDIDFFATGDIIGLDQNISSQDEMLEYLCVVLSAHSEIVKDRQQTLQFSLFTTIVLTETVPFLGIFVFYPDGDSINVQRYSASLLNGAFTEAHIM